ncbi:UDP-N-acetylmuramoylalanyl-D-glutamate--2,6-diaminopimelate ligase [Fibrobacter sp. UWH9]|uniref:UDP-N-acetylmuramoyl-L-alanyl-D-glutamate--2, 6-diaminopimelate ligase n=1 Tax=Fibrobacter sp. UWH9 TaxID=1896213 RepID=UPI000913C6BC|nr:UDP-N-acetylmuramoyl-L-alanyl-D-glutamate--2,6-diaminopimelate ligase [Fibrobacter sp. UWH9]SHH05757.1 UDP-N-acetylmuramoylalanyl-D-glutamate--2,6-diaminopimelate ligase [Fibrobacter sp. UWH9]
MLSETLMKNLNVRGLCDDSRRVKAGDLFFSLPTEGYEVFARNAVAAGAVAVVGENVAPEGLTSKWIQVSNVKAARLEAARIFYKDPFAKLTCHAVTGTNGKTTSAFLMDAMLTAAGKKVALLGTIKNKVGNISVPANLTTPGQLDLFAFAAKAVDAGCTDLVMETSSHALHQGRVAGISYRSGLFSNLTQDHLDYHKTMEAYFDAKKLLFTKYLASDGVAVINVDDAHGALLCDELKPTGLKTVGVSRLGSEKADVKPCGTVLNTEDGLKFDLNGFGCAASDAHFETALCGDFNVDNVMLVLSWANAVGISKAAMDKALAEVRVPGRFEKVWNKNGIHVIVDYAHTPDALERVLMTARSLCRGKLSCIFGCGGDRDKTKRPIMGEIAERLSDKAWLTSDNPRTENPADIINDVKAGMKTDKFEVVELRDEAIKRACAELKDGDWLVVAGKGHEDYQIIGKTKHHFDDHEEVVKAMENV